MNIPIAAVISDLSGLGRCALSTALSVLPVMGVQTCALPTALLSAHTAFPGVRPHSQTAFLKQALGEWNRLNRVFQAVQIGYLSDPEQAAILSDFIADQKGKGMSLSVVDPIMGDHGKMYRALSPEMPAAMKRLCATAQLILPNPTEAALLTGLPYRKCMDEPQIRETLDGLLSLGCGGSLITGVGIPGGQCANVLAFQNTPGFYACVYQPLDASFPGTGDLFASSLMGFLLNGLSPDQAMARATAFVYQAVAHTLRLGTPAVEGVAFEPLLAGYDSIPPAEVHLISASPGIP